MRPFLSLILLLTTLALPSSEALAQQGAQSLRRSKCLRGWPLAMRQNNLRPSDKGEWLRRCRAGAFDSHGGMVR